MIGLGPETSTGRPRVIGADVARGIALFGMMSVHVFPTFNDNGTPTPATVIAGGRSATAFVVVAGVSLAFISGGRSMAHGRDRSAVSVGIVVRAVLIGVIGLALSFAQPDQLSVILAFYALMFLLAIPLLGLRPRALAGIAAAVIALGPVLLVATADLGLPHAASSADPTLVTLVHDPLGLLVQLLITGSYPVVVYMAYFCAGLALGRLDLNSRRLACWMLCGGLGLAVTARIASWVLLYPLGGLARLIAQGRAHGSPGGAAQLLWEPDQGSSWWYLALPSPHADTPVDLVYTLGSAMAVLGAALLLTRVPAVARLLRPVAVAGTMTLTLYCAHVLLLRTGVLQDDELLLYVLMVAGALTFALLWRRWCRQGPLEWLVAVAAGRARRTAAEWLAVRAERAGEIA
jgi:uncharacterized membrane protein YeiB